MAIAKTMPHNSNIILCSAEPGWYKAEAEGNAFRTLSYAAWIAENAEDEQGKKKNLKFHWYYRGIRTTTPTTLEPERTVRQAAAALLCMDRWNSGRRSKRNGFGTTMRS